jgi:transposase-like protein
MSKFICNVCNKEFTTKYGLKKHNDKKTPCKKDKINLK